MIADNEENKLPKSLRARRLVDKLVRNYDVAGDGIREVFTYLVLKGFGRQLNDFVLDGAESNLETIFSYIDDPTNILDYMTEGDLEKVLQEYSKQMEVNTFIDSKKWNKSSIRDHLCWLDAHDVEYTKIGGRKDLSGKGEIHKYVADMIRNAKQYVIFKSGDFDFVTPSSKPLEEGMLSGKEWIELYTDTVNRGVDLKLIMNLTSGWTKKIAKILESTGAEVKHMENEWRVGIVDGEKMFGFMNGPKDEEYTRRVGTSQIQLDKMFYLGYVTTHKPFVKRLLSDLDDMWEISTPVEKMYKVFTFDQEDE